jgi:hypothetical protein
MFSAPTILPIRKRALVPLLLLAGCGSNDKVQQADPPPFLASGSPDNVCVAQRPAAGQPLPGLAGLVKPEQLPPSVAAGLAASAPQQSTPADAVLATAAASDPLGEPIALAATSTPLIQATLYNTAAWPIWWGNGKPVDGVNCLLNGNWHKHMLISIYNNGQRLGFPDGIGRVHAGCYHAYEMHVHDVTGIVHMESDTPKNFTLGQWFTLWNQPLSRSSVAGFAGPARFYIIENGTITRYDSDPAAIPMLAHREILIVTGTPLAVVPRYQWPLGL